MELAFDWTKSRSTDNLIDWCVCSSPRGVSLPVIVSYPYILIILMELGFGEKVMKSNMKVGS